MGFGSDIVDDDVAVVEEEESCLLWSVVAWRSKKSLGEGCKSRHSDGLGGCWWPERPVWWWTAAFRCLLCLAVNKQRLKLSIGIFMA